MSGSDDAGERRAAEPFGEALPPLVFRTLFKNWRPRGYMRLGTWMSRVFPTMRHVAIPYADGKRLWLNLEVIDHQPLYLNGCVVREEEELRLVRSLVQPGASVADVGANLGVYSVMLACAVGPAGRVLSYEPDAQTLILNAADFPQVIVRPFAVADVEKTMAFQRHRSTALSHLDSSEANAAGAPIRTVSLDEELRRFGGRPLDLLKVDVEGAEERVFLGARGCLTSEHPPVLMFEWVPGFRDRWQRGAIAVLDEMLSPGWRFFRFGWDRPARELERGEAPTQECNILAIPPSRAAALRAVTDVVRAAGVTA